MNRKGILSLSEQSYDIIQAHILDPENSPLPEKMKDQFNRVLQCARLLDEYPNDSHILSIMRMKYRISDTQIRKDISLAKELFKTEHSFDWDFWFTWQIKDQLELIRQCKLAGNVKEWNKAKVVLNKIIGDKPEAVDNPRRMEKNVFYIQVVNANGERINFNLDTFRGLSDDDRKDLVDVLAEPIDDKEAEKIMNS